MKKLGLFALFLLAILIAASMLPLVDWARSAIVWSRDNPGASWLVFIAAYLVAGIIMTPTWILTVAAGYIFGWWLGIGIVFVGAMLGAMAAFLVGRGLARELVQAKVAAVPKFSALDRAIEGQGFNIVLLARLSLLLPYNLLNYAFGVTAVSFRDYAVASAIGMTPMVLLYVFLGTTVSNVRALLSGDLDTGSAGHVLTVVSLIALVVLVTMITRAASRVLRGHMDGEPGVVEKTD